MDERETPLVEISIFIRDHDVDKIAHIKSELRNNWHFEGWYPTATGFHGRPPNEDVNWKRNGEDAIVTGRGMARIEGDMSPEKVCIKLKEIALSANGGGCDVTVRYRTFDPNPWVYVEE